MNNHISSLASIDFPQCGVNFLGELKSFEIDQASIRIFNGKQCEVDIPAGEKGTLTLIENCIIKKMFVEISGCTLSELSLKVVEEVYSVHRRNSQRMDWSSDVLIRDHESKVGEFSEWIKVKSSNISATGMRFMLDGNADLPKMVDVKFVLKDFRMKPADYSSQSAKLKIVDYTEYSAGTNISACGELICGEAAGVGKRSIGMKFINLSSFAEESLNAFMETAAPSS